MKAQKRRGLRQNKLKRLPHIPTPKKKFQATNVWGILTVTMDNEVVSCRFSFDDKTRPDVIRVFVIDESNEDAELQ